MECGAHPFFGDALHIFAVKVFSASQNLGRGEHFVIVVNDFNFDLDILH